MFLFEPIYRRIPHRIQKVNIPPSRARNTLQDDMFEPWNISTQSEGKLTEIQISESKIPSIFASTQFVFNFQTEMWLKQGLLQKN